MRNLWKRKVEAERRGRFSSSGGQFGKLSPYLFLIKKINALHGCQLTMPRCGHSVRVESTRRSDTNGFGLCSTNSLSPKCRTSRIKKTTVSVTSPLVIFLTMNACFHSTRSVFGEDDGDRCVAACECAKNQRRVHRGNV